MKKSLIVLLMTAFSFSKSGQSYGNLAELKSHKTKTFYSHGASRKAERMAEQLNKVMDYYTASLQFPTEVTLLILPLPHWNSTTKYPV